VIRVRAVMNDRVVPVDQQDLTPPCPVPGGQSDPSAQTSLPPDERPRPGPRDGPAEHEWDVVDEWGCGSFPASDPPANW
jgi:hypothetical protein